MITRAFDRLVGSGVAAYGHRRLQRHLWALEISIGMTVAAPLTGQSFAPVDAAVQRGMTEGVYPGAVVVIGREDTILYSKGYGHFTWSSTSKVPDPGNTLWDLASLSKVVATTSSAAVLVDSKRLDLDAPVSRYLPEFVGAQKDNVTVRMLLNHTSGLPAGAPLYSTTKTPAEALAKLYAVPLIRKPGTTALYSDLNAILAGLVIERASGMSLDVFSRSSIFGPLGMTQTIWRPAPADRTRAAPTGHYHNTALAGEVNDLSALRMGGVAGNAGLFSTGMDLARYAQSWLHILRNGSGTLWAQSATLQSFMQSSKASGSRLLGWDTPSLITGSTFSLYGHCATRSTIGHTGWTGTLLWLDRDANIFVVFLTNRSFEPRTPAESFKQLKEIRALVSDAARRGAGEKC